MCFFSSSIIEAKPVSVDKVQKVGQTKMKYEEKKSHKTLPLGTLQTGYKGRSIKQVREITDINNKIPGHQYQTQDEILMNN